MSPVGTWKQNPTTFLESKMATNKKKKKPVVVTPIVVPEPPK
jgi:hypothetical protein